MTTRTLWALAAYLVSIQAVPASGATCIDAPAVAAARSAIAVACPCASATNHGEHVRCAAAVVNLRVAGALLPRMCKGTVKRCASRSSCGKPDRVTCCRPRSSGAARCKITTAARCTAGGGCVSAFPSCCDACAGNGCATSSTTTSTTTTTLPAPACGNGVIEGSEQCDGDPFCETNCFFTRPSCCEFATADPTFCAVSAPTFTFIAQQTGYCQTYVQSGESSTFRLGMVPSGSTPCATGSGRTDGACVAAPSFPTPISVCRRPSAVTCEDHTFADPTALTQYLWNLAYADPSGWADDVVLGTCGGSGTCVPAH